MALDHSKDREHRRSMTKIIKGILFTYDSEAARDGVWYYHGRRYSIDLVPVQDPDGAYVASLWDDYGLDNEFFGPTLEQALGALIGHLKAGRI